MGLYFAQGLALNYCYLYTKQKTINKIECLFSYTKQKERGISFDLPPI